MYVSVLPEYIYMYHMHVWCPWRPEEDIRSPGTGVMNSSEPPYGVLGTKHRSSARVTNALKC